MASVDVRAIDKLYGEFQALYSVSLTVKDGEFVVLVGPSGCGKSTLLRMIAGLEAISAGEIMIGGKVVNSMPPKKRDIAMVFQNYALYPHKTVRENMGFSLKLRKEDKSVIKARVAEAASMLDLESVLDRYPRQLSGGQRQRVAMGRAIVRNPQVYLFDEPLSNLDAKLRVQMRTEIKELHQRVGTTAIYVTHDQIEAMTLAERIVVLNKGRIEQVGTPMALFNQPDNLFVAEFIGSPPMNVFSGHVACESDGVAFFRCDSGARWPFAGSVRLDDGMRVRYGVRPEHIRMVSSGGADALPATIKVVEPMGSESLIVVDLYGDYVSVLIRQDHDFRPGEAVKLTPLTEHVHAFDGETGNSLRDRMAAA
jgi:multiple sugar transport system ATP-binding protein